MTNNFSPPDITPAELAHDYMRNLRTTQGVDLSRASQNDLYQALGLTVRGLLMQDWMDRLADQFVKGPKVVAYLSAEYLLGPQLLNTLLAYDIEGLVRAALSELGLDLDDFVQIEPEPGLGNGGLGRLPLATSTPWPPWASRLWGTASDMNTASSDRCLKMVGRWNCRTSGSAMATLGSSLTPTWPKPSVSVATPRATSTNSASCAPPGYPNTR